MTRGLGDMDGVVLTIGIIIGISRGMKGKPGTGLNEGCIFGTNGIGERVWLPLGPVDKSIGVYPEFIAFKTGKGSEFARRLRFRVGIECMGIGAEAVALSRGNCGRVIGDKHGAEGSLIVTTGAGNKSIFMLLIF